MSTAAERDKIMFDAAQKLLDLPSDLEGGMPVRVVMVIELHSSVDGEPYIRSMHTASAEWWHALGMLYAADRSLTPGNLPMEPDREEP